MTTNWQVLTPPTESARISVIIPCYNLREFVGKAIESALEQVPPPVDVVVVDNGSEDDSWQVIKRYEEHVKTVRLAPNKGVSAARNAGAEAASGNWLLFLDADDYLNAGALDALSLEGEKGGFGVVYGGIEEYNVATHRRSRRDSPASAGSPPLPALRGFWRSAMATPGAAMVHRSVHEAIGGFEKPWQPTEDRDYWLKCGVTTSFRYSEFPVLTKLKRAESMRVYSNWAPLWGMRVQIEFLQWCRTRNIDTGFLEVRTKNIVDRAVKRAVRNKDDAVLREIRAYCARNGLSSFELKKQSLLSWFRQPNARAGT